MKRAFLLALLSTVVSAAVVLCLANGSQGEAKTEIQRPTKPIIVGYVAGYRDFNFSSIEAEKLTHINYAFANIIEGELRFEGLIIDEVVLKGEDLLSMQKLKEKNSDLKILISVGGWLWSNEFSDTALTEESRQKFAKSCVRFLKKHKLDGIDLDWEYPGQVGAGNVHRPEDRENFTLLLKAVREHLDAQSEADGLSPSSGYLLTIASGARQSYIDKTNLREAHRYLDFINIMCYDFVTGNQTGHHANLHPSSVAGASAISAAEGVERHVNAGVPVDKLVLGVPFYGRKWRGVSNNQNGYNQPAKTNSEFVFYRSMVSSCLKNESYTHHWDDGAKAPYLWNASEQVFISYENEKSLKIKMKWLKKRGLRGAMFWEYSDDQNSTLLNAVYEGLNE